MTQLDYLKSKLQSTISLKDFMAVIEANPYNFLLVDVRNDTAKIKKIKIKNSIESPERELQLRLDELSKDKLIVVYGWDTWCNLAMKASIVLLENGYQVKELIGGITSWKLLNLPLEKENDMFEYVGGDLSHLTGGYNRLKDLF